MKRREFITLLGGAAAAWPAVARAQQSTMPLVVFLNSGTAATSPSGMAFREGLKDTGFVDGQNVKIEYHFAEGKYERLGAIIAEATARQVAVLAATGGVHTALAAKSASNTIPVVFANGSDPVQYGLVASLNRPGGNMTGVSFFSATLEGKRLGLLSELVPSAREFGVLINPTNANAQAQLKDIEQGGQSIGRQLFIVKASTEPEIEAAFEALRERRVGALLVAADPLFFGLREKVVALADRYKLPTIYEWRDYAQVGGLASYGTNLWDAYRSAGVYAGRILRGEKPADLPVVQSTKFAFVINLKTAKALGLDVSPTLSARADEVIE